LNLNEKDKAFVWHPFTHLKLAGDNICIVKAAGSYYFDDKGNQLIDAISSWWVNLHGHSHPYISKKVGEQMDKFEHAIFSGFTHQPAVELAERLLKHLPKNLGKVFYSDNGSTSVEVALKMALQYWNNKGKDKTTFLAFENAYHGDTFGGMSVGERNVFNKAFSKLLFDVKHIPLPDENNIEEIKRELSTFLQIDNVAAFIFEPLIQGAAGMKMYEARYLDEILALCKEKNVICIADEVMTGFGRTGKFFASDYLINKPDIICLSKGLTGGYLPLGVTSCDNFIYEAFLSNDKTQTFFHGHSYTANPTSCAAALASMDLMEQEGSWNNIERIEKQHASFLNSVKEHKSIKDIRLRGTILAIELNTPEETHYLNNASEIIAKFFIQRNILLRPLGNVFYILPPYCISDEDLAYIYASIVDFLDQYK
jgi:adenosylmethionine---8-amino-7-oxononanoate aminotransferase